MFIFEGNFNLFFSDSLVLEQENLHAPFFSEFSGSKSEKTCGVFLVVLKNVTKLQPVTSLWKKVQNLCFFFSKFIEGQKVEIDMCIIYV